MNTSVYTLLIVESPVIARIIQKICPSSVYVISTEGYCWRPKYDYSAHQLKAVADPDKVSIRKELKEQARLAGTIVVAVDSDASGDFIAWAVNRFIQSSNIKRGRLQSLSRESVYSMFSETSELDESQLEVRLKNRFLIHRLWKKHAGVPDIQLAGLISVFGASRRYLSFLDERNRLYRSTKPVLCGPDEWISVRPIQNREYYRTEKPLSTFNVLEYIVTEKLASTCHDAQLMLQQLFQTVLPFSEESLISYPRTSSCAFYSDTWNHLRRQYLQSGSVNELKPIYLQEIADNDSPHESIHPINFTQTPDSVSGELPGDLGKLYSWIYNRTVKSLTMPEFPAQAFVNDLHPDVGFYPDSADESGKTRSLSLRPCLTLSELGIRMNRIGVVKPSGFGKMTDEWLSKGWIRLENQIAVPGMQVLKELDDAGTLRRKLQELNRLREESMLARETVVDVITS